MSIQISTIEELQAIGSNAENPWNGDYELANDIEAEGFDFAPIGGDFPNLFQGTLDGKGFKIKNLTINKPDLENVGLFSTTQGAFSNITFENVDITGAKYTGALCGTGIWLDGMGFPNVFHVNNCKVSGVIKGTEYVGGLCGDASHVLGEDDNIVNCEFNGEIVALSENLVYFGGVVGGAKDINLKSCKTYGILNVLTANRVGGITGSVSTSGNIRNCTSNMTISGKNDVGGITGFSNGNLYNNTFSGEITGGLNVGFIVGLSAQIDQESVILSENKGKGILTGESKVGGIVGYANTRTDVDNCYSEGVIEANENSGGIIGHMRSTTGNTCTINNSLSNTQIVCDVKLGGLVGWVETTGSGVNDIQRSFFNKDKEGMSNLVDFTYGKSSEELTSITLYIENEWDIISGDKFSIDNPNIWFIGNSFPELGFEFADKYIRSNDISGNGGTVLFDDKVIIKISPKSLKESKNISIRSLFQEPLVRLEPKSSLYQFGPSGTNFNKEVDVTFEIEGTVNGNETIYWSDNIEGPYRSIGGNISGNKITGKVKSFSYGFVGVKIIRRTNTIMMNDIARYYPYGYGIRR